MSEAMGSPELFLVNHSTNRAMGAVSDPRTPAGRAVGGSEADSARRGSQCQFLKGAS